MSASLTVIIPAHNAARTLGRAIRSARTQTSPPTSIIVVDDGSSDGTADAAGRDGATVIRRKATGGAAAARNDGLHSAQTDLCAFLDADDAWYEDHLATLQRAAERYPAAALWLSGSIRETAAGEFAGVVPAATAARTVAVTDLLLRRVKPTTSGAMVRTDAALAVGGFDTDRDFFPASCEDLDFWLRLAVRYEIRALPAITVIYRVSDGAVPTSRLRANERGRLRTVARATESSALSVSERRRVWTETFRDLGKWYLKHGTAALARARFARALRYSPWRVDIWAWVALTLLPSPALVMVRSMARRCRAGRGDASRGVTRRP